jgi:hypothetical protein
MYGCYPNADSKILKVREASLDSPAPNQAGHSDPPRVTKFPQLTLFGGADLI